MDIKHFPLGTNKSGRFIAVVRIAFGIVCLLVAAYYLFMLQGRDQTAGSAATATIFLVLFGAYLIWAGAGRAYRFIEISDDFVKMKRDIFRSPVVINGKDLSKIDFYPMNILFHITSGKTILLRFGSMFHETNDQIRDTLMKFAEKLNIDVEIIEDKL